MNQPKLLIVDDEPGIVDFIQKIYQRKGFVTFGATDGIVAVAIYQKEKPEVTLIDVHMPYSPIDGVETLQRIKEINPAAACIMISRITDPEKVGASRALGAAAYILKPIEIEAIDEVIFEATGIKL
jgi:DNA-binding response OmpR family regulator